MRWYQIALNLLVVFLGLLFKSELERIDKIDPATMIGSIPIAWASVLQGLIGACIVAFVILNWSAIRYVLGFYRRFKISLANKEYQERESTIKKMTELRDLIAYNPNLPLNSFHRPPEMNSAITIYIRELQRLELAPPEDTSPQEWVIHLDRLMPFVRSYQIEEARREMASWYPNFDQ